MEHIILGLLIYKSLTIYEINSAFKESLSLIYSASYGSIQNAIKKLLKNDMITFVEEVDKGRKKKIYSIEPAGKDAFFQWMQDEISESKLETNMLIKIYFLGFIDSKQARLSIVKDILGKVSEAAQEISSLKESLDESLSEEDKIFAKYPLKTLDYGVMSHEAAKNWVNEIYETIKKDTRN
ncbi:helix-turn-helix transcriptional regulator [Fusibacter sp. JL216-2]|uniref:helix-turn-helix transcriptional regulator n=1 Tax=Fusibacter sp. JL216-2 TaxID=3071453 RepID=UPI003D3366A1